MSDHGQPYNRHEERIADLAADKAVKAIFRQAFGLDITDADAVNELREDLRFTRDRREAARKWKDTWSRGTVSGFVTVLTAGVMWLIAWAYSHSGIQKP